MKTIQEIENTIKELQEELRLLKTKENFDELIKNFEPGNVFKSAGSSKVIISECGWNHGERTYFLSGLDGNPCKSYSTFYNPGATKREILNFFARDNYKFIGKIKVTWP